MNKKEADDLLDSTPTLLAIFVSVTIVILGVIWLVQGNDFFLAKVFAPRMEQIRRETFEQSKAYNEGVAQELRRQQLEYINPRLTVDQKKAIGSVILHQTAGYDTTKLPPDLQQFLNQIKQDQGVQP